MKKTTVYLPDDLAEGLNALAYRTGGRLCDLLTLAARDQLAPLIAQARSAPYPREEWPPELAALSERLWALRFGRVVEKRRRLLAAEQDAPGQNSSR